MDAAPTLTEPDSLSGVTLGISVSDSADLGRLGLAPAHCELAVGEIARAVFVAGGSVVYGGRLKPPGFTQFLMHELRQYGRGQDALTLVLALPEHQAMSAKDLHKADRELGVKGRLVLLDAEGHPTAVRSTDGSDASRAVDERDVSDSYSAMRTYLADSCDARLLVGGKLSGFRGVMPGIIEEAIASVQRSAPLFVSAGFGGAAALVAQSLEIDNLEWAPHDFPANAGGPIIQAALEALAESKTDATWTASLCGLSPLERARLAVSHRPSEIASLVVSGLSRIGA